MQYNMDADGKVTSLSFDSEEEYKEELQIAEKAVEKHDGFCMCFRCFYVHILKTRVER